ncbi:MAG: SH3 domain-containing protein [Treponema sp.]|nr:SH3 domain-containing protein [Treponema sp.]
MLKKTMPVLLTFLCMIAFSCKEKESVTAAANISSNSQAAVTAETDKEKQAEQKKLPDYKNGNGTILSITDEGGINTVIRKCEMEIPIGPMLSEEGHTIYEDHNRNKPLAKIQDGDTIQIEQACAIRKLNEPKSDWGSVQGEHWFKVKYKGLEGWICSTDTYLGGMSDPYEDNRYEVLQTITNAGKTWTVRKMEQEFSVWENLNIRDKPGLSDNVVVYTIRPGDTDPSQTIINGHAITEEMETIDGIEERWIKISYKEYEGWVFGAYATTERGGPHYYIPEDFITFELGDLP